ncbi:hypothetical protein P170DRAFT_237163 [Aspergillus steynii IBT 23096]|uniref:Uncharacterized protein n=1 Tax=Aspergillus steynii IBT 23096 TaxID=1392250 RepID=A0A2I2G2Z2_9EURO|nr:uncharacterized protein P170DRAFT_237163 [Aspergillus steynii IBT 23096]PLB47245.1 hypothetical protein P170DRAFT_237163 [Aspergillus steynii IBT 23096]
MHAQWTNPDSTHGKRLVSQSVRMGWDGLANKLSRGVETRWSRLDLTRLDLLCVIFCGVSLYHIIVYIYIFVIACVKLVDCGV